MVLRGLQWSLGVQGGKLIVDGAWGYSKTLGQWGSKGMLGLQWRSRGEGVVRVTFPRHWSYRKAQRLLSYKGTICWGQVLLLNRRDRRRHLFFCYASHTLEGVESKVT